MTMRSVLLALPFLFLAPSVALAEDIVIVVGKSVTARVPFPIGQGANSNPKVVQAVPDMGAKTITFFGRQVGSANYTVSDARSRTNRIEFAPRSAASALSLA